VFPNSIVRAGRSISARRGLLPAIPALASVVARPRYCLTLELLRALSGRLPCLFARRRTSAGDGGVVLCSWPFGFLLRSERMERPGVFLVLLLFFPNGTGRENSRAHARSPRFALREKRAPLVMSHGIQRTILVHANRSASRDHVAGILLAGDCLPKAPGPGPSKPLTISALPRILLIR